jgi:hypothetical protein
MTFWSSLSFPPFFLPFPTPLRLWMTVFAFGPGGTVERSNRAVMSSADGSAAPANGETSVKVVLRVRPMLPNEVERECKSVIEVQFQGGRLFG